MRYTIIHTTTYTYFEPVSLCHNIARLVPRSTDNQFCAKATVKISPQPDTSNAYQDFFGNTIIYFSIEKEHKALTVQVISEIEKGENGGDIQTTDMDSPAGISAQKLMGEPVDPATIRQFVFETPMTVWNEAIHAYALQSFREGRPVFEAATELMHRIYADFEFEPGITTIATPLSVVMKERKGVCQDFAHFAIGCIRSVGLPARYVSGYIETISPEGQEKLVGADASHAWFSMYVPSMGWLDFDPTNNIIPGDQHITIGWGRDYADIAPLQGIILSSGQHELTVSVDVKRKG